MKSAFQYALSLICKTNCNSKNACLFALLSHCFTQIIKISVAR